MCWVTHELSYHCLDHPDVSVFIPNQLINFTIDILAWKMLTEKTAQRSAGQGNPEIGGKTDNEHGCHGAATSNQ